jgi:L-tartrate/succinate antiporter
MVSLSRLPWRALLPLLVGLGLASLPVPDGLTPDAWRYFALFAAIVVGLVLEPIPAAGVGFVGMALAAASRLAAPTPEASLKLALGGFANGTVWLIFAAFMFALGYERTGLGRRIALVFVHRLGSRTLGLGYAVTLADLVLAPFTPSNTARSAGTIFPVIRSIPPLYDSHPGPSARRIGAYIMWTEFAAQAITSSMFVTALAPNLLALGIVENTIGYRFTMVEWFRGIFPVGLVLVAAMPWLVYKIYPPGIKGGSEVPRWAAAELERMGPVSRSEWTMAGLALVAIAFWVFGGDYLDATTVALVVVGVMLSVRIVSWSEIVAHKDAWSVLVLLATLVGIAEGLNKVGFVAWFAKGAAASLAGLSPVAVMAALVAIFFVVHYLFASLTAHTTAVLPVVLAAGIGVPGIPVKPFALLLCYALGMMGVITPYATGPAPVFFESGYVSRREFWTLGLVFGTFFLATLLGIGVPYLTYLYR